MKKIMFNDKFGLTQAVLDGRKTMTKKSHTRKVKDLSGMVFGHLTVLGRDHIGIDRKWYYLCQCDCGNTKLVRSSALTSGNTQSCGCSKKNPGKHNQKHTRLYRIWCGMKSRCYNQNNPAYKRYGGIGISVCQEWKTDFAAFKSWADANGYSENLSIDRIDTNGNYSPENCRWATAKEQADNKRCNILVTIDGETMDLQQWCDRYGINRSTVNTRVRMCGWDYQRAITTPARKHKNYKPRNESYPI